MKWADRVSRKPCSDLDSGTSKMVSFRLSGLDAYGPPRMTQRIGRRGSLRDGGSILFLFDFQIHCDVFSAIKTCNGVSGRFGAFFFRVDLIVGIWIETAEAKFAGIVRVGATHDTRADVLEKHYALGEEIVGFVLHYSVDGAELGFALGILGGRRHRHHCQNRCQKKKSLWRGHFFSPAAGCIRNTIRASLTPVLASSARV